MHPKIPVNRVSLVAVCAGVAIGCASTPASAPSAADPRPAIEAEPSATHSAPNRVGGTAATATAAAPGSGLRFQVEPSDALVIVGDEVRGTVAELSGEGDGTLPLPPGLYQVSIKRAGYRTWRGEVAVGDRAEVIEVTLEQKR